MARDRLRVRPLLVRPGARFYCHGDGLCCTDIHVLGPLTRPEALDVRALRGGEATERDDDGEVALKTGKDGSCVFLDDGLCEIHARLGMEAKPMGCRRFPFGLVATPAGGRVTTEHRCPCRSLGERPPIEVGEAEAQLTDPRGRLKADDRACLRMRLTNEKRVSFKRYAEIEAVLLARLAAGENPLKVLRATPFPELDDGNWLKVACEFIDMDDDTAGGVALAWFGDAVLQLSEGHRPPRRERPWAGAFDRAIARCRKPARPVEIYDDWIADEIWMLRAFSWGPFDVARAELATRYVIARQVAKRLRAGGVRADQAAAEAVMVVDVATGSTEWPDVVVDIRRDPSPAGRLAGF
jgi:Fe-S-cluster containining protein